MYTCMQDEQLSAEVYPRIVFRYDILTGTAVQGCGAHNLALFVTGASVSKPHIGEWFAHIYPGPTHYFIACKR